MSGQTDKLISLLEPFGLMPDEAAVYLELLSKGVLTALQISRNIQMGRTKVYRILDKLIASQLVSQQFDEVGMKFTASEPTQLELLLSRQEGELQSLRSSLPQVLTTLEKHLGASEPGSKTLYYRGIAGLLKVNFNTLSARDEFCSLEVATADAYMSHEDAEELRRGFVENKIYTRSITNLTHIPPFTDVREMVMKQWDIRYIDPKLFEIKADMFIYNNVYAICNYIHNQDVFCLEIYNRTLAEMQKQLFQNLWHQTKKLTIINENGEARLL